MKMRWLLALALALAIGSLAGVATARVGQPATASSGVDIGTVENDLSPEARDLVMSLDPPRRAAPEIKGVVPGNVTRTQQGYQWMIDDFEQEDVDLDVFKGWLLVEDTNGKTGGEYYWGVSDCRYKSPTRSAWAIGNGQDGSQLECGDEYPSDAKSSASLRVDLSGWNPDEPVLELAFDFWLNARTEVEEGVVPDGLFISYLYPSGRGDESVERIVGRAITAKLPDRFWDVPIRIDLTEWRDIYEPEREPFNLAGLEDVDIEFLFVTKRIPGEVHQEGAFIDNVRIEAFETPVTQTPRTPTARPTSTPLTPTTPGTPATATSTEMATTPPPTTETPDVTDTPTDTPETPVDTPETPVDTPETPVDTPETPVDTPETPVDTPETPVDTPETPEVTDTPTDTATPTETVGFMIYMPIADKAATEPVPTEEPVDTVEPTDEPTDETPTPGEPTTEPTIDLTGEPTEEPTTEPPADSVEFDLLELEESGISGTAVMLQIDTDLEITLGLDGTDAELAYPASIYTGTCADIGEYVMPLSDVEDGVSVTLYPDTPLADFTSLEHLILIEDPDLVMALACGEVPQGD
ncbi:MAG: hypothetical protein ACK2UL_07210 [Anaerolineae bacterium]